VPSGGSLLGTPVLGGPLPPIPIPPTPLPATHLVVLAPKGVITGQTFPVVVIAENMFNLPAYGFTDQITLSSSDPTATGTPFGPSPIVGGPGTPPTLKPLPIDYTFTLMDHGFHVFLVNLTTVGSQTVTATDDSPMASGGPAGVLPGTATIQVNPVPVLGEFAILMPKTTAVGAPTPVTIIAEDSSGHILPGFTGTVTLSTSDSAATGLPPTYTFLPTEHGIHTFKVTFNTPDTSATSPTTVTATDGSVTNTASILVEPASAVTHFAVFQLAPAIQGTATPVVVVALNAANQVVPGYNGNVTFSSSDSTATASATFGGTQTPLSTFSYTFGASDNGIHVFFVTFGTPGKQTFTVSDMTNNITKTINVFVIGPVATSGHSWWTF
jgi:hypothetical protein